MIETSRLLIKPFSDADAGAFFELTQDAGFNAHPITVYTQKNIETANNWIADSGKGMFAVREKSSGDLIGMTGLREMGAEKRVEITYRFKQSAWGKGYATEAAKAVLHYGFENLDHREIAASITPENVASKKVAEKLGMHFSGYDILYGVKAEIFSVARPQK